jgi:serine/threonine-protein kinase
MDFLPDRVLDHLRELIDQPPELGGTRYELVREIGRGGMGTVYMARDTRLDRHVALKVLNLEDPTGAAAARMLSEARILARLEHPGIVPVHDAGTLPDGRIYYAMKLVQGVRLDRFATRSVPELLRVFIRVCEPVAFAHSHGIIHRDLKPDNIMVGPFGEVLVLDWGVAKVTGAPPIEAPGSTADTQQTAHGTVVGTPEFMAPEQASGAVDRVDARSDVYALGKTLESLLSRLIKVPRALEAICRKAAAAEPSARYDTAVDLAADVARYLDGLPVTAYRENLAERALRLAGRHKTLVALVVAYLVMRLAIFAFTRF